MEGTSSFEPNAAVERMRISSHTKKRVTINQRGYVVSPTVFDGSLFGEWKYNFLVNELVSMARGLLKQKSNTESSLKFLEVGAGMGAIAIEFALQVPQAEVWATDINPAAVDDVAENARLHGVETSVTAIQADVFDCDDLKGMKFDMIFFRPPAGFCEGCNEKDLDMSSRTAWDPNYSILERYLKGARGFLGNGGKLLLTTPVSGWGLDTEKLEKKVREASWEMKTVRVLEPRSGVCAGIKVIELVDKA
ncbi:predicted protein [Nematostella vectensis]|uniref:Methyltransferase domain-containing protein n=1 Tax=Nematostella vectensis TaxID=45351 RepID=A7T8E8_NEMVE|nr:predicted protein [Nematostella vectensis]|eukprot:XP_001619839.1 hypothetical protein NEMVEDRAFT_v1g223766 [Nematostella vectensis]